MPFEEVVIGSARLIRGDCREVLASLPAESVQCCVTSPPFYGLRDYGVAAQIGLEQSPQAYIAALVDVFREVRRVLRKDGTLWLNMGDSYGSGEIGRHDHKQAAGLSPGSTAAGRARIGVGMGAREQRKFNTGTKPKDLLGIPWMLAFALRDDGWYLRRDIIWHKPNPMPESVRDRCTSSHEYLFHLSKAGSYYYDSEAIKESAKDCRGGLRFAESRALAMGRKPTGNEHRDNEQDRPSTRNKRSVWTVTSAPFKGAHFATFPPKLIEPCILAGTSAKGVCPKCGAPWTRVTQLGEILSTGGSKTGARASNLTTVSPRGQTAENAYNTGAIDQHEHITVGWRPTCSCAAGDPAPATVLDPFGGASTTALVADRHGRRSVSIELSQAYFNLACERIEAAQQPAKAA